MTLAATAEMAVPMKMARIAVSTVSGSSIDTVLRKVSHRFIVR